MASCSVFVSLDGLSDGDASDASLANEGSITTPDANVDGSVQDSGTLSDGGDGGDGSMIFLDDFNRPDAALIGNAWI